MKNNNKDLQLFESNNFDALLRELDSGFVTTNSLQDARVKKGLSQAKLAALVNMQQAAIARLENPGYTIKYLKTLEKIAKALGADFIPPQLVEKGLKEKVNSIIKEGISIDKHDSVPGVRINILQNDYIKVERVKSESVSLNMESFN